MFQVSKQIDYAVQFLLALSLLGENERLSVRQFATNRNISFLFLQKIVRSLRIAGLVDSTKGPQGGYRLNRPKDDISMKEIIEAIEGPIVTVSCMSEESCPIESTCMVQPRFVHMQKDMIQVMKRYTLTALSSSDYGIS